MKKIINNPYGLAALSLILLFVSFAYFFSTKQNLWVDESTQLSGLSLPAVDLYLWLGGFLENPFLVPGDRMPVLSYWVGKLWIFFTNSEVLTLRWLSTLLVTSGICLLARYLLINKMYITLVASLVFLCLSTNLVVFAVEIRAYALFFLLATISSILFLDTVKAIEKGQETPSKYIYLAITLGLAINTHIFGLLLAGSIIGSYIILALTGKKICISFKLIMTSGAILSLAVIAVAPSIFASVGMTQQEVLPRTGTSVISSAVKLIYRLVSHQSIQEIYFFPIFALLVVYGTIIFSLVKNIRLQKLAILLVLTLGFTVAFLAKLFITGFNPLSISYNIWMFPFFAILFGMSVADLDSQKQQGAVLAVLAVFLVYGQYNLFISGEKYAHTRFSEIESRAVAYSKKQLVAIVYNGNMAKTWFAGVYKLKNDISQFIPMNASYRNLITGENVSKQYIESNYDVVISTYGRNVYSKQLVNLEPQSALSMSSPAYKQIILPKSKWRVEYAQTFNAQESADLILYRKY